MKKIFILTLFILINARAQNSTKIAFLADIHFQDLYGSFSDDSYRGVFNPKTHKLTLLRTMQSQLNSTRIFNENYFALFAALDDIAAQNIKIVALPGDFSDDGQAYNLRGLKKILDEYEKKYNISFFITTGNHDPVRPLRRESGKTDFLGEDGAPIAIMSTKNNLKIKNIITKDISESGYEEVAAYMKDFGFYPEERFRFWQTPFSKGTYENYSYQSSLGDAASENRIYETERGFRIPDLSYIVEPESGIWLMAIDGNAYIPEKKATDPQNPDSYQSANTGYNNVMSHKLYLLDWVKRMSHEAEKRNKILIAFTHYPMLDYNSGATPDLKNLLGQDKWQLSRVPNDEVAKSFAEAGLKIHFAGHMHINDTGVKNYGDGKFLFNIQVPSLAAYAPGYKILTVEKTGELKVETKIIKSVPRFKELFPLYKKEYEFLTKTSPEKLWNKKILKSKNYRDFTLFHLQELVRLRLIPSDWPKEFIQKTTAMSGLEILNLLKSAPVEKELKNAGLSASNFKNWTFGDALFDLYKLQSADELAKQNIPKARLQHYEFLEKRWTEYQPKNPFEAQMKTFFTILEKLSYTHAAGNFQINLENGEMKRLP